MKKTFRMAALFMAMAAMTACSSNSKSSDKAATDSTSNQQDTMAMCPPDHGHGPEDGPHGEPNANDMIEHRMEEMQKELNLTDEQKQKVIDLMTAHATAKDSAKCDGQKPDEAEMKKAHEEEDAKMKEILTAEQYTKYQEMQKKHGEHHGPHGPEGHHGPKPGEGPAPK